MFDLSTINTLKVNNIIIKYLTVEKKKNILTKK